MPKTIIASLALALTILVIASTEMQAKPQSHNTQFDRHDHRGFGAGHVGHVGPVKVAGFKQMRRKHQQRRYREKGAATNRVAVHRHKQKQNYKHTKTASLDAVTPKLAVKARELISECGAKVISGYRPGARVRGFGTASLHSRYPAEAIDMKGDTSCIYPRLKGWPGGFSVDYAAVRHIHISLASDRRERGARFAHYGTRRYAGRHR